MPELPDVAGFKKYMDATSLHQRIAFTSVLDERIVKGASRRLVQRRLKGASLEASRQWGKWLFVELSSQGNLVLHFGMSGQLEYSSDDDDPPEHSRFLLHFENGRRLAVISVRMIGRVSFAEEIQRFAQEQALGPDALDVDADAFVDLLSGRRGSIKAALMNQSIVAGIGNVYSDEILFQSGLRPDVSAKSLNERELRKLHKVMRHVLATASNKGGDGRKAPRSWLLGSRGDDTPCPSCGGKLQRKAVNGRTAWFCPNCQEGR